MRSALLDGPDGRLRAPWRIASFLGIVAGVDLILIGAMELAGLTPSGQLGQLVATSVATLVSLVIAHAIVLKRLERRGWEYVRLDAPAARPTLLAGGAALGAGAILVPTLALSAAGWFSFEDAAAGSSLASALVLALALLPAACVEELLLRGYVLSVLGEKWGMPAAVLATSIVFGLLHWANPGATWQSILVVTLAGIFLGLVVVATRSLYAACAAHLGWNWVLAGGLHAAVSGLPFETPDYRLVDSGPDWATGGVWGPEGGAGAVLGLLGGISYLYLRRVRREES